MNRAANIEAKNISEHFSEYLRPVVSDTEQHAANSFRIRHNVYCEELQFEPETDNRQESDEYDSHSTHCMIQHKPSEQYAGTVRIITASGEGQDLPIEKYCSDAIEQDALHPCKFARNDICEISRLAVPQQFRRRQMDKFQGAATGAINEQTYSETELRCFPFIAVGLYLSATSILIRMNINHCYVMVEPRLARSMRFVGLPFQQIGPVVDYHGKRAPFYIRPKDVPESLNIGFKLLLDNIDREIGLQI